MHLCYLLAIWIHVCLENKGKLELVYLNNLKSHWRKAVGSVLCKEQTCTVGSQISLQRRWAHISLAITVILPCTIFQSQTHLFQMQHAAVPLWSDYFSTWASWIFSPLSSALMTNSQGNWQLIFQVLEDQWSDRHTQNLKGMEHLGP